MTIQIVKKGKPFIFDSEDWALISKHKWRVNGTGYVYSDRKMTNYVLEKHELMHRFILGITDPNQFVDHINRIKTDNRRCNLRLANFSQNSWNVSAHGVSKYVGVSYVKKRYITAAISVDGKKKHLGSFKTEEDAALAYNEAAKKYRGEFATINNIVR